MPNDCSVYDPQEDSTLLEKHVKQLAFGNVLDIGTGSGIQALAAAQNPRVASVLAADVQKGAVSYCKKTIKNRKIKFVHSDLFKKIKGKFDTIIFNPPYLPQELKIRDAALEGGKKGYEVIEKFLMQAGNFLRQNGIILMVFSSLTKKGRVEHFIKDSLFDFVELEKSHIFFEDIYVYLLKKNDMLKKFESIGIKEAKYFTHGHRGVLFRGMLHGKNVVIKAENPSSTAINRVKNETRWLKILNRHGIGPKLLKESPEFFVYGYIEGEFIEPFIKKSSRATIKKILLDLFRQMYILDRLNADKEEMHHPHKHVIISKKKPVLVDFERMHKVHSPKNATQFCQYLLSSHLTEILAEKKIYIDKMKFIALAKAYKRNMATSSLKKITDAI